MPKNGSYRKNGQVVQPGIEYEPEGNGWPTPLVSEANPIKHSYTVGKNGKVESRDITRVKSEYNAVGE